MPLTDKVHAVPYGRIHYWVSGPRKARPWLVFLPGLTADHRLFDQQIAGLEEEFNCFVWDAPGHGASRPFQLRFSLDDKARYLHDILEDEGITHPILIGQSMGGYLSQVYLELYPEGAGGFLSIDSCPLKREYYTGWELALLKHTKGMYLSIPWKLLVKWGSAGTSESEYGHQLMRRMMEQYDKAEYCALADHGYRIVAEAVETNRRYDIPCPVWLLCGEKDQAGSAQRYNREWQKREDRKLIWLPGAGHNSNTDVPEKVNEIIRAFARARWE